MAEVSVATRHVMQANRSTNTRPERMVREALRRAGLPGYRLHWKVPGRPDVCYPGRKVAIFVNGCYWHRCARCALPSPKSNAAYWEAKFARNRERDQRVCTQLMQLGWTVIVVWECQLKRGRCESTMRCVATLVRRAKGGWPGSGRLIEVTPSRAWRISCARRRLARRG